MHPSGNEPATVGSLGWSLTPIGLWLVVLPILVLSGPGHIDIQDGQARYLVAKSLVDYGEPAIRDPDYTFYILPGRDGNRYSFYRFLHSLLGMPAIWLADATGPASELRRQFFFTLIGAVAGATLSVVYYFWFRGQGCSAAAAVGWALAGIFCTPCWFYSTSTFDDIIGTLFIVAGVVLAWWGRVARPLAGAALAGLAFGLAVNSKQPLGIFALPALVLLVTADRTWKTRLGSAALLLGGLMLGVVAYLGYEWYKFPPGSTEEHARILEGYVPPWPGNILAGLIGLLLSPAAGVFWYCPTLLLGLAGLVRWRQREPRFYEAIFLSSGIFVVFVCSLTFYKGDLCWGPRYLTPFFALLWLFVPTAARAWPRRLTVLVLSLGLFVQFIGLSVEPLRLYVSHRLGSGYFYRQEWVHFRTDYAHLLNRPREILEICQDDGADIIAYSPSPVATSSAPLLDYMDKGPEAVRKYRFLASFRPWWINLQWLAPPDRPVALLRTTGFLLGLAAGGLGLLILGIRPSAVCRRIAHSEMLSPKRQRGIPPSLAGASGSERAQPDCKPL